MATKPCFFQIKNVSYFSFLNRFVTHLVTALSRVNGGGFKLTYYAYGCPPATFVGLGRFGYLGAYVFYTPTTTLQYFSGTSTRSIDVDRYRECSPDTCCCVTTWMLPHGFNQVSFISFYESVVLEFYLSELHSCCWARTRCMCAT